ncbi:AI-2E family transporter [Candidatus Saccharibacteria bacterium]|nr:AI-2E family transporter [Candidatus Saccharibacteria bacterium]
MESGQKVTVSVANRTIVRAILWVVAAILIYRFIGQISHVLTLILAAIFLALALNPVVAWIRRRLHIDSRIRATAVAYLLVVVFLSAFVALIVPPLVRQTRDFIKDVPTTVENFQKQNSSLAAAAKRYNLDEKLSQAAKDFTSNYGNFGTTLLDTGRRVAEAVISFFVVLVLTFMMLVEGPRWLTWYLETLPEKQRSRHKKVLNRIYKAVSGFVNGQVILAAVAGFFAFIALEIASQILDVSVNAVALAGIVAVFGIIPLFGNPIAAAVVVLVSLLSSVSLGITMAIYFTIYFFIENHTFQPYIQARLNELSPLLVLISALVGVGFGGILGAIIAIPAASTVKIILEDQLLQRGINTSRSTRSASG